MNVPHVLQRLRMVFQPIIDLNQGTVFGHEALARGESGSPWELPQYLFPAMRDASAGALLERRCRELATSHGAALLPLNQTLFVNLDTHCLPFDLPVPERFHQFPHRLAIEISEQHPILNNNELLEAIGRWRQEGHLIVLDDYGTGYAAANTVIALQPDIVKLDISLIHQIDQDRTRQSLVASIRDYTLDLGIRLVAEGIETEAEYQMVQKLGIDYGQGFLLGMPDAALKESSVAPKPTEPTAASTGASTGTAIALFQFYQEAIQQSAIPTYIVDRRRRIVAWNDAAVGAVGHPAGVMLNQRCSAGPLQHQDEAGRTLCVGACPLVSSMVTKSVVGPSVVTLLNAKGTRRRATTVSIPIWDPERRRVIGAIEQFQVLEPDMERVSWEAWGTEVAGHE